MKLQTTLTLALLSSTASAFAPVSHPTTTHSSTSLEAINSRRQMMGQAAGLLAVGILGTTTASSSANAESRPMYLTEPTEEFKANEAKAAEFKRAQLAQKKKFLDALEKLMAEKEDEAALEADVYALKALVVETEGLPIGIKKDDFYKQIRTKKAKGYWPTKVEIAYQSLKNEILFQQSPDSENKAEGSPY